MTQNRRDSAARTAQDASRKAEALRRESEERAAALQRGAEEHRAALERETQRVKALAEAEGRVKEARELEDVNRRLLGTRLEAEAARAKAMLSEVR